MEYPVCWKYGLGDGLNWGVPGEKSTGGFVLTDPMNCVFSSDVRADGVTVEKAVPFCAGLMAAEVKPGFCWIETMPKRRTMQRDEAKATG